MNLNNRTWEERDEKEFSEREPNPYLTANFISKWSFWWTLKLFRKGYKRPLKDEDIYLHKPSFDAVLLTEKFAQLWDDESKRKHPSIIRLIIKAFGLYFLPLCIGFAILETIAKAIQPYCLGNLISYFSQKDNSITKTQAYMYATGIVISLFPSVLIFHPLMFYVLEIGLRVRVGLSGLIYRKILKVSKSSSSDGLSAKIINVLSNDVSKFDYVFSFVHDALVGPMQVIVLGYLAYLEMGYASFVGIGLLLFFIPIEAWGAKKAGNFHQKTSKRTDFRVKLMNEIILGIQIIKMYAWEKTFAKIVSDARKNEIKAIRGTSTIYAFLQTTSIISKFAIFLTILSYLYTGNVLTAKSVFTISSIFDILNRSLIYFWPTAITYMVQANISAKRILEVLQERENVLYENSTSHDNNKLEIIENYEMRKSILLLKKKISPCVILKNVSATWNSNAIDSMANVTKVLFDVNIDIKSRALIAVIGSVGSGKSSLLNTILGELQIISGNAFCFGKFSYASQESWIFEGTVRDNIVFNEVLDIGRYNEVLKVCALEDDIKFWPHGDLTMVGEHGISLSGGQKARINLARAIYRNADIYIFDDPLSAVDAHVANYIFEECFKKYLNNKIRILAINQTQFLKEMEKILLIHNGSIEFEGDFENLQKQEPSKYLKDFIGESIEKDSDDIKKNTILSAEQKLVQNFENDKIEVYDARNEKQEKGSVKLKVFTSYFKALDSWKWLLMVILLFIAGRGVLSGVDYFISRWVIWEEDSFQNLMKILYNIGKIVLPEDTSSIRINMIIIYSCLLIFALILYILRSFGFFLMCLRISLKLHDRLFNGVIRATMYFFNITPSGRILNRFSKDMNIIDVTLPMTLIDCIFFITDMIAIVIMVSIANYWLLIPAIFMAIVFIFIRKFYISTSRSVKRIESASRSPIYSHVNKTFQGLVTIRSIQAQQFMEDQFNMFQNSNASSWFLFLATTRAFVIWLDFLCVFYIGIVTYSFLLLQEQFFSGDVGLAVSQSISLITMCQWGLRQSAELEIHMTSVERILEYSNEISEAPLESTPENCPKDNWPFYGKIVFSDFNMKYSNDGEYILKNLNFEILPREKIGIVGRTGAGKSSIIQAIFRLACNEGEIKIDDIDISRLGLHDLRSKISIIPQDPVLFSGTLRYNLDPFNKSNDDELWKALEDVELKEFVSSMIDGLNFRMSDGGSNFSMGQRQLVCLARAILRQNKILILDEATANVDPGTDKLIQKTIQTKFEQYTVLTIAHRLHTVMDSDRIFVMDHGELIECGNPFELLQKADGHFKQLVYETGSENSKILYEIAEKMYIK